MILLRRRTLAMAGVALGTASLLWATGRWHEARAEERLRLRGAALFHGDLALAGRVAGHVQALPPTATRCSNCHEALSRAPGREELSAAAPGLSRSYASAIHGKALTTLLSRHGGPPSDYDEARLCDLLRTGVDPGKVMIPRAMPRYEATSDDCASLWAYLRHEPN